MSDMVKRLHATVMRPSGVVMLSAYEDDGRGFRLRRLQALAFMLDLHLQARLSAIYRLHDDKGRLMVGIRGREQNYGGDLEKTIQTE